MKKGIRKLTSLLVVAIMVGAMLLSTACQNANGTGAQVMTLDKYYYTSDMYKVMLSFYKSSILQYIGSDDSSSAAFWNSTSDQDPTLTYGEYFNQQMQQTMEDVLVCNYLFDKNGMKLTASNQSDINSNITQIITNYCGGQKTTLDQYLAAVGGNFAMFKNLMTMLEKYSLYQSSLDTSSDFTISDTELADYFHANMVCVKHILINDIYEVDSSGNAVTDSSGNQVPLTDDEKAAKDALIADIQSQLAAGADFDTLMAEYSEDPGSTSDPEGYYLLRTSNFIPEFIDAAFDMQIGEVRTITSSYGTHIMKRYPLDDAQLQNSDTSTELTTAIQAEKFDNLMQTYYAQIVTDDAALAAFDIASLTSLFQTSSSSAS